MSEKPRILIVGTGGRLGSALLREYGKSAEVIGLNRRSLDLGNAETVRQVLQTVRFDALINCAAQTNVDRCETERAEAWAVNAEAPQLLAEICTRQGAKLVHISTDYVFDGTKSEPYTEAEPAVPVSVYGESKLAGERGVLQSDPRHLVVRVSWVFGPDRTSFIDGVLENAQKNETVAAVADKFSTPTYTIDLAAMLRPFLTDDASGLLHLTNGGECSWQEYAQHALDCAHAAGLPLRARKVEALALDEMKNFIAKRPRYTVLSTAKYEALSGKKPRPWREAVAEYVSHHVSRSG
ncbi:MAG TPA: dTDP-4-dehydrorhamnose reductase [Chthoniobacterales bacterium]|nr:dTDP-4-dehydrorhamnose reductase [Chthoniobacterales bacterium]